MGDKKVDPIPDNMTIEEASDFWDTHSVADYPSHAVALEFVEGQTTLVAIDQSLLEQLEDKAKIRGVSVETLVNLWIQEKLAG
ncbi:MAG: CopG family antitoxin [Candidatus Latescibacteria bacterium]|nr:CopG family antitoxin [Candidatus Latescibacterota bacterium]